MGLGLVLALAAACSAATTHSYKVIRSTGQAVVSYNGGEIEAPFTDRIKSVVVYDESVSTAVAPAYGYLADTIAPREKLVRGVSIVRHRSPSYEDALEEALPKRWRRAGDIDVGAAECVLVATSEHPPTHFGFRYSDAGGRRRRPFYWYFVYVTGPRDDFSNLAATEAWAKTLKIRPPGLRGEPRGCLDFRRE